MITLRKLRWNEELEALGDLFDLDKTTTEKYFDESKHEVINLVDILTAPSTDHIETTSKAEINYEEYAAVDPILLEPIDIDKVPINEGGTTNALHKDDDEVTTNTSESSTSYVPSEFDPDVESDDFTSESDVSLENKTEECSLCNQWCTPRGLQMHL